MIFLQQPLQTDQQSSIDNCIYNYCLNYTCRIAEIITDRTLSTNCWRLSWSIPITYHKNPRFVTQFFPLQYVRACFMTHSFLTLGFISYDDVYITNGVYIFWWERFYGHVQLYFLRMSVSFTMYLVRDDLINKWNCNLYTNAHCRNWPRFGARSRGCPRNPARVGPHE